MDRGGAARVAVDQASYLGSQKDVEVTFAYGRGKAIEGPYATCKIASIFEVLRHVIITRLLGIEGVGSGWATRRLQKLIRTGHFDLIHIHNLHGYYLNFFGFVRFLRQQETPVVWTLHDEWSLTWMPGYSMGCPHCMTGEGRCVNPYPYPKTWFKGFDRRMLRAKHRVLGAGGWVSSLIVLTDVMKRQIQRSYLREYPIRVISNGVQTALFKPGDKANLRKKHGFADQAIIGLFVAAKLSVDKGYDHAVEVADMLADDRRFQMVFVGAPVKSVFSSGVTKVRPNIRYMGSVKDRECLAELYAAADFLIFPSGDEICPLTVLEAMASGLPVVGYALSALKEIVGDWAGVLVPLGDKVLLAKAVRDMMALSEKRQDLSKEARRLAVARYDIGRAYDGAITLYDEILAEGSKQ